jgi:hypothetical protein
MKRESYYLLVRKNKNKYLYKIISKNKYSYNVKGIMFYDAFRERWIGSNNDFIKLWAVYPREPDVKVKILSQKEFFKRFFHVLLTIK